MRSFTIDNPPQKIDLPKFKGKTCPDVMKHDLNVLFIGINPSLYTAAIGHHFGRPGNRFWPALHRGGFTDTQLSPYQEKQLLKRGIGLTNVVHAATATADELQDKDLIRGGKILKNKIKKYNPKIAVFLGIGAYRKAYNKPKAKMGLQSELIGRSSIWILPNPSGLNANYQLYHIAKLFNEIRLYLSKKTKQD